MQRAQNKITNLQSELASFKEEGGAQETGIETVECNIFELRRIILIFQLVSFMFISYFLPLGTGVIMQNTPSIHPPSHTMSSLSPVPPHSGSMITASNGEHLAKINTQLIQVPFDSENQI